MIRPKAPVRSSDVARHYDDLDRFYRSIWGEHVHHGYWISGRESAVAATENLVDFVAEQLNLMPGSRVCDVGCGYGGTARRLSARYEADVVGVTLSQAQADFAATRSAGSRVPRILAQDWLRNDFADRSFDAVLSIESSEHMPDPPRFFSEAFRTLAAGGRFVVCAWLSRPNPTAWQERHLLEPICREGRLVFLGTADEYLGLMREAGFANARYQDISRQVSRTWSICIRRATTAVLTNPEARRFLFDAGQANRVFAATLVRIRMAYALGALRYGVFTAEKPSA